MSENPGPEELEAVESTTTSNPPFEANSKDNEKEKENQHIPGPFHQQPLSEVEKLATETDNKYAQFHCGRAYDQGRFGAKKNQEKAIYWYSRATRHEFQPALVELSDIYIKLGVNSQECIAGLLKATTCKERSDALTARAFYNLGTIFSGVQQMKPEVQDYSRALGYLERAAELDHAIATGFAAQFHLKGWGTDVNYGRFKELAQKAAALGDGKSALLLARVVSTREEGNVTLVKKYLKMCKKCVNVSRAEKNIADEMLKEIAKGKKMQNEVNLKKKKKNGDMNCRTCGKRGGTEREGGKTMALLMCSRCKGVKYCSKECQVKDWKRHKRHCGASRKKNVGSAAVHASKKGRQWERLFNGLQIPSTMDPRRLLVPFISTGLTTLKNNGVFLFSGFRVKRVTQKDTKFLKSCFGNTTQFNVSYHAPGMCCVCPHCRRKSGIGGAGKKKSKTSSSSSFDILAGEIMFRGFNTPEFYKGQEVLSQRAFPRLFHADCVRQMRLGYDPEKCVAKHTLELAWELFLPEISEFQKSKRIHSLDSALRGKGMVGSSLRRDRNGSSRSGSSSNGIHMKADQNKRNENGQKMKGKKMDDDVDVVKTVVEQEKKKIAENFIPSTGKVMTKDVHKELKTQTLL